MCKKLVWIVLTATVALGGAERLLRQGPETARQKSEGCISANCHVGIEEMHVSPAVRLGCTDCHGGHADTTDKKAAHVQPRNGSLRVRSYALLNKESPEYVRFLNPGDLRVADQTCGPGGCHTEIVYKVRQSMMT